MPIPVPARNLIITALLLLQASQARAVIGDDLPTLRTEYGSAKEVGGEMLFRHAGYSITVAFDGTRSAQEIFVRDGSIPSKPDMTQADVDDILATEGGGQTWNPVNAHSGQPTWVRSDSKLLARFNPTEKILIIMENAR